MGVDKVCINNFKWQKQLSKQLKMELDRKPCCDYYLGRYARSPASDPDEEVRHVLVWGNSESPKC